VEQTGRAVQDARVNVAPSRDDRITSQHLEEIDRCRLGKHNFSRVSADEPRDLVPNALRHRDPVMTVPARNQVLAPFLLDYRDTRAAVERGNAAQRIAVEVDHSGREQKFVAQRRQKVDAVQRLEGFTLHLQDFIEGDSGLGRDAATGYHGTGNATVVATPGAAMP
jgi:hypothetical protein